MNTVEHAAWRTSSHCTNGTCVEVARVGDRYLIRDSKQPQNTALSFTEEQWTAFVDGVTAGEFQF
jgi:predicted secreted Zn-dependent protease